MAPTQLEIKVNALNRLLKEEKLYEEEIKEHNASLEKLKQANGDEYEVKKLSQILKETEQMVPVLKTKISDAVASLKQTLSTTEEDKSSALEKIKEAEAFLGAQ